MCIHILFTHSLHGHLVCLYLMAIVNNAAIVDLVYKYPCGVQVSLPSNASMVFPQVDKSSLNHLEVGRQWM